MPNPVAPIAAVANLLPDHMLDEALRPRLANGWRDNDEHCTSDAESRQLSAKRAMDAECLLPPLGVVAPKRTSLARRCVVAPEGFVSGWHCRC